MNISFDQNDLSQDLYNMAKDRLNGIIFMSIYRDIIVNPEDV